MSKLPKLSELHHDNQVAIKNDQLKTLLNNEPPKAWLKPHPFAKSKGQPIPYIPIGRIEMLLDSIFQEWKIEVLREAQLFNSVCVTVRVHYRNPIDGQWSFHDGVGAMGIQTDKGASASDLTAIKQDAVMKALPAAKSYAIKDAADHLGKLFGRDIGRPDDFDFKPKHAEDTRERERILKWLTENYLTLDEIESFEKSPAFNKYKEDQEVLEKIKYQKNK